MAAQACDRADSAAIMPKLLIDEFMPAMTQRLLFSESSANLGGQELQILQQMQEMKRRGIEARLLCPPASRIAEVAAAQGLETIPAGFRNSLDPRSVGTVIRHLRAFRPQALISHSGHDANVCALAARLSGHRPLLIRVRTYQPGMPKAWTYNRLADLTLVPSEEMRRSLLANPRIDARRIRVLYPGIAFDRLADDARAPLPAPVDAWLATHPGPLLVHAAMLRQEKGHAVLIDALIRLVADFPDLRCVMAGEGELHERLAQSLRDKNLSDHVLLAGLVPRIAALYRRADLLVMPSLVEPLGMSQSEALGLELPVVASRTGGIPETIEDGRTGLLVAPGDVAAWTESLAWALRHPNETRSMARAGREYVLSRFSLSANVDQLLVHISDHVRQN